MSRGRSSIFPIVWKRDRSMFQVARRDPVERKQFKLCDPAEKGLSGQGNPRELGGEAGWWVQGGRLEAPSLGGRRVLQKEGLSHSGKLSKVVSGDLYLDI